MEQLIKTLAEGQQKLQDQAAADRQLILQTYEAAQEQQKDALAKIAEAFTNARRKPAAPPSQLPKFQPDDDPTYFFENFERVAKAAEWPEDQWAFYIAPLLSGSLQTAYQAANPSGTAAYVDVKQALLERLGLDMEAYRLKARAEKLGPEDTPMALYGQFGALAETQ